jgi:hypothetical protein
MKRNSEKCVFNVPSGKLRGIKVNLENTTTIMMKMGLIKKLEGCPKVNRMYDDAEQIYI